MSSEVEISEESERRLRRSLQTVARSTPVQPAYDELMRRIEAEPAPVIELRRRPWRVGLLGVAAAAALVVGVLVVRSGDGEVDTGPADGPVTTAPDPSAGPSTTEVPSRDTAPGGMVPLIDPLPDGWFSNWAVDDDGPLAVRLLRSGEDPSSPVLLVSVSRQASEGQPGSIEGAVSETVAGTDVVVVSDPGSGTTTAMWNWVWPDGSEHGVEVTMAGLGDGPALDVVAPLVPDALADVSADGIVELPYALGAGAPGPSALYYEGVEPGGLEISLFDVPLDDLQPDIAALRLLTGQALSQEPVEVDGRPGWLVTTTETDSAVLAFELPSGRIAVIEGPRDMALDVAPDVVEAPVDEAIARLEAGRAD